MLFFPEYPERYGDEQFRFINFFFFFMIISVLKTFGIVAQKCPIFQCWF